jgi:hypothetical protein
MRLYNPYTPLYYYYKNYKCDKHGDNKYILVRKNRPCTLTAFLLLAHQMTMLVSILTYKTIYPIV